MESALLPFISAHLVALLLTRRRLRGGIAAFAQLDAELDALEEAVLSGRAPARASITGLTAILVSEIRLGHPVVDALRALRVQLESARTHELETRRLARALLGRAVLATILCLVSRLVCAELAVRPVDARLDLVGSFLAGSVTCAAVMVFLRLLPRSWAWSTGPTDEITAWLRARIGRGSAGLACEGQLRALAARELRQGISLRAERLRLLDRFASGLGARDRERLRQLEDILPVLELVGLGLPLALLILAPLRASL